MFCKNCGKQVKLTDRFCNNCGQEIKISRFDILKNKSIFIIRKNKRIIISLIVVFIIVVIFVSMESEQKFDSKNNIVQESSFNIGYDQNKIALSVVNIFCDNDEGGSGTIMSEEGLILTNNHVIANSTYCLVILPDEKTGQPAEMYKAEPIIIPDLSEEYDLAGLAINDSFTDEDGKTWGTYPTVFSSFVTSNNCSSYSPRLGEDVIIYGYPVTSGGYNLTITDGVISSFNDDGTILTSAKIDSGNSGGLAINKNGCFVGVPSAVINGNYQNLGVIIPQSLIDEFIDQASNN